MSIRTILICDCGEKLELEGPYHTVKEAMKAKGWKNMKDGEGWKIRCPECKGK